VVALLSTICEDIPVNFLPCDLSKEVLSLKLGKACGFDDIPNECLWYLPRRPFVHMTCLFNHCLWLDHFLALWKEAEIKTLMKPNKDPTFSQNVLPVSLLSIMANYLRICF
jgi:hypothetical protein